MLLFGISDIVYIFLFVVAASVSRAFKSKKVFLGFVFVFGIALICGFYLSRRLYISFESLYITICALVTLGHDSREHTSFPAFSENQIQSSGCFNKRYINDFLHHRKR
jgi:hypothetical protein